MHAQRTGLLAFATKVVQACVAERTSDSWTREPWLSVEALAKGSLRSCEFQPWPRHGRNGSRRRLERGFVVTGTIEVKVS